MSRHFAFIAAVIITFVGIEAILASDTLAQCFVLRGDAFKHYVDFFNANDEELYPGYITNGAAWNFLKSNIPLFECPDKDIETIYYFRWWTYRKHIKLTPDGFIITEFLPDVPWAGKDDSIDCAAGHHLYEGRWLADPKYLDDYSRFWFRDGGGNPRLYSTWLADALWARFLVNGDTNLIKELLPDLVQNYEAWEKGQLGTNGLFWQIDDRDGMEWSISGNGYRPTINSYMYGDAIAIAKVAHLCGQSGIAKQYRAKAAELKRLVQEKLWNTNAQFFEVLNQDGKLANVRELLGYTPWYFNLPDADKSVAWKQLMDPKGFYAPYGPTTAEQRSPRFTIAYSGHECQWNGPSWPYATSLTLTAMANLLDNYRQSVASRQDYFDLLKIYTKLQHLKLADGQVIPWIDEDLDPYTGVWIARKLLKQQGSEIPERGKDYNHSAYCDLIITGLVGLRPRADTTVEVDPLVPDGVWNYFCLDNVHYHGHILTIFYDKTGKRYGKGKGLRILVDGKVIAASRMLSPLTGLLPRND
jgi:Mannosylglycerate hydrolase MGH1-like glycoside hydrolase domain/Glycosyl hydrolase family 65, C-terminal domain